MGDHDIGSPGRPVSFGLQVPGEPGHCRARTRPPWFLLCSRIMTGNHLDHAGKFPNVAQTTGAVDVFDPHSGISGPTLRRASACPNPHE